MLLTAPCGSRSAGSGEPVGRVFRPGLLGEVLDDLFPGKAQMLLVDPLRLRGVVAQQAVDQIPVFDQRFIKPLDAGQGIDPELLQQRYYTMIFRGMQLKALFLPPEIPLCARLVFRNVLKQEI